MKAYICVLLGEMCVQYVMDEGGYEEMNQMRLVSLIIPKNACMVPGLYIN